MHIGIDALNIRQGGGLTHLSQLLHAAAPNSLGITKITVFSSRATLSMLPQRPWLEKVSKWWMNASAPIRIVGQQFELPRLACVVGCNVLFSPGGTLPAWSTIPQVTMSQNMLPFEQIEAARFGRFSRMRLKMRLLGRLQRRSFRNADGLIFLTDYAARVVGRSLGGFRCSTARIAHGVERRFFSKGRKQLNFDEYSFDRPFRLLYVSILMPYKHQLEVATAVHELRLLGWPIQIQFIGPSWGEYGRAFQRLIDESDPRQEFLIWSGDQSFSELHEEYQRADGFIFASSCENLPNILIEAMASGLPIVCSNSGPMPEILGDAGLYFNPNSTDSIRGALTQMLKNREYREECSNRAFFKAQSYDWAHCAKETLSFLSSVAVVRDLKE